MQLDVRVEVLDGNFARGDDDGARDSEKQHRERTVDGVQLGGHVEARAHPRDLERWVISKMKLAWEGALGSKAATHRHRIQVFVHSRCKRLRKGVEFAGRRRCHPQRHALAPKGKVS